MMSKAIDLGLFEAVTIRRKNVKVSHLQFADNTLLMGAARVEIAWTIKRILRNLELLSGLKVNFEKCNLLVLMLKAEDCGKCLIYWTVE
ncbi:hypothetical protein ACS0TY_007524 [Phlomoides rotata]